MASETLSLFPSPVCSMPPKSCLRQAEVVHTRQNTPSPVLNSKPYPSGKLRGLALQLTPQVSKSTSVQSPAPEARPAFSSPISTRSTDHSMSSSSPQSATGTRKRPAVAIRKTSIDTTSSDTRSDFSGPTLIRSDSGSSAKPKVVSPPIKSMFPEYDPNLPLSQQPYYPAENLPRPSLERKRPSTESCRSAITYFANPCCRALAVASFVECCQWAERRLPFRQDQADNASR
jgi:hypothetical protein